MSDTTTYAQASAEQFANEFANLTPALKGGACAVHAVNSREPKLLIER